MKALRFLDFSKFSSLVHSYQTLIDFLIPFLIIYIILFEILKKTKILGENSVSLAILSVLISLIVCLFTPFGLSMFSFLQMVFAGATLIMIILTVTLIFAILLAMIRGKPAPTEWPLFLLAFFLAYKVLDITGAFQYLSKIFGVPFKFKVSGALIVTLIIIFILIGVVYIMK